MRGLSGSGRIELPCLVDQLNCGEVYYITWTRQSLPSNSSSASASLSASHHHHQQQAWTRVYLYTGANDTAPHKPIGELLNRANFIMPEKRMGANSEVDGDSLNTELATPLARLVIEEPKLSDEALYKCDVTYVKGKCPSISLVRVQMMALPAKAQIVVPQSSPQHQHQSATPIAEGQTIGPYNEHEQLKLVCLVYGGRPQPKSVIWRKIDASGRTINLIPTRFFTNANYLTAAKQQDQAHGSSLVEVHLNHTLSSSDLGAKFECHVEHEAIEQPSARIVNNELQNKAAASGLILHDSMLDLHPSKPIQSAASIDEPTDTFADHDPSSMSPSSSSSSSSLSRSKSLDSHVYIDLNGK